MSILPDWYAVIATATGEVGVASFREVIPANAAAFVAGKPQTAILCLRETQEEAQAELWRFLGLRARAEGRKTQEAA